MVTAEVADDVDDVIDVAHCFAFQRGIEITEIMPYFIVIDAAIFNVDEIQNLKQGRGCGGVVIEAVIRQKFL